MSYIQLELQLIEGQLESLWAWEVGEKTLCYKSLH